MGEIVGIMSGSAGAFYGNIFLPLYLSMSDRKMLLSKYNDPSDWIELKLNLSSVMEGKKGSSRCWLMDKQIYSAALRQSGYAQKNLKPINFFNADEEMSKLFLARKTRKI